MKELFKGINKDLPNVENPQLALSIDERKIYCNKCHKGFYILGEEFNNSKEIFCYYCGRKFEKGEQ